MPGKPSRDRETPRRTAAGFTLIELLVVITILAALLALGARQFGKFLGAGKEAQTVALIEQVKGLLEQYRNRMSDYPPCRLGEYGIKSRNNTNEGIEAMVVGLFHKNYDGARIEEKYLMNQDDDVADKNVTDHAQPVLLEVVDAWENPLVYIRYDQYQVEHEYEFVDADTNELETCVVTAAKSELTGSFYAKESYQLLSVGEDGVLGTEDDLTSYKD
ncbi:MAG: prepilin-type N-terminal cleavage/methylation domain-containing protein [Planctomycetota bacterium]